MQRLSVRSMHILALASALAGAVLLSPCRASDAAPAPKTTPSASMASDAPSDVQQDLESVMQAKIGAMLSEKNSDGVPYKRGTFSRRFIRVDDSTYQTTFHRDTARDDDTLLTERFLVTFKKEPASEKWKVAKEELQDSYSNLYRRLTGNESFQKFDSIQLSREGLTITGGRGELFKVYRNNKVDNIVVTASDLKYEYKPTERKYQLLFEKLKKDNATDVLFKPEYLDIGCDPTTCDEILATAFQGLSEPSASKSGGAGASDPKLRNKFDQGVREFKKARRENPFAGFRRPFPADRKVYNILIAKDNPDRLVALSYDSWEQREVAFWVYNLDKFFPQLVPVYSYYSEATLKSGADPYDLERRDDPVGRDCDLVGLEGTVEMGLDDAETLKADVTFKLKTKRELRELPFAITRVRQTEQEKKEAKNPQMTINSIEDGDGNPLTWVKLGQASGLVILPKVAPAGTPVTLHMVFENQAAIYNFTSTFSYVDRYGWLPFVRFTDMISDFKLTVKVPARKHTLGIGRKVSDRVEGDVRITEWVADSPVEFPSVTFGEYIEMDSKVEAKKSDGTKIPVRIHVDKTGIPILEATYSDGSRESFRLRDIIPITPSGIQFLADQAANALNLYREIYGVDYPYGKLDLVNDPLGAFYGQSPSSLIYLGEATFGSQGAVGELGGGQLSKFNRQVVPHEVGHQWWGSLIPNHNDGNYWFVESLAEYSSALFIEATEGKTAYQDKVEDWRRRILDTDLQSSVQDASVLWSGHLGEGYTAAVYNKGPYAFHVMRMTWGDEKFFKFLKMLAQDLKNKGIVTRDIQREAEKAFGGNMDFFFDQWLRGVGTPEFTFTYSVRETEDRKYLLEGQVDQRVLIGTKKDVLDGVYYTAIVPITVIGKSGKEYRIPLKIDGPTTPFKGLKLPEQPKEITFNKYGEALAYDVIVKKG